MGRRMMVYGNMEEDNGIYKHLRQHPICDFKQNDRQQPICLNLVSSFIVFRGFFFECTKTMTYYHFWRNGQFVLRKTKHEAKHPTYECDYSNEGNKIALLFLLCFAKAYHDRSWCYVFWHKFCLMCIVLRWCFFDISYPWGVFNRFCFINVTATWAFNSYRKF